MSTTYALILAGGVGSRLWPRSRSDRPKQLLELISHQSMLQETTARLEPMLPPERVIIMTNEGYVEAVREQLPGLPPENVVGEPAVRGTASAIGYGAAIIAHRDPSAVMFSLHADHYMRDVEGFRCALQASAEAAREGYLVTLGITPERAETGYGYVERAEALGTYGDHTVYRVARFTEKPGEEQAQDFVKSGRYYWNSGLFTWQVSTVLDAFATHMPDTHQKLQVISESLGTERASETVADVWPTLKTETIDYGIMEQAERVAVVPADFGWSDVGSWDALYELRDADADHNVIVGNHVGLDTRGSYIYSESRLIATAGVEDLIVVDAGDAVLVCPRGRAQDVKSIVERLKDQNRTDLL